VRGFVSRLVALALITACGSGGSASYEQSHSPSQILADADLATISTRSYHVAINETAETGPTSAEVDVENGNASGKIIANGIRVRITHVNEQTFIYGSDLAQILYITNPRVADTVNTKAPDRWVLVPPDIWSSGFSKALDLRKMSSCLKGLSGVVKKGTSNISGHAVVELDDPARSQIYVQTAAPHHYVRVVFPTSHGCATDSTARSQMIDLTQFEAKFNIAAPAGYADLTTLAAGG